MTNDEIQYQLDELEKKRKSIYQVQEQQLRESDYIINNLRDVVSTMKKNVDSILLSDKKESLVQLINKSIKH